MSMINPKDKVVIYRNGHLFTVGIAKTVRGYNQEVIEIDHADTGYVYLEAYRETGGVLGCSPSTSALKVKVVTDDEWFEAVKKTNSHRYLHQMQDEVERLKTEERLESLAEKAQVWYDNMNADEKELLDAYMWKCRPIAVA